MTSPLIPQDVATAMRSHREAFPDWMLDALDAIWQVAALNMDAARLVCRAAMPAPAAQAGTAPTAAAPAEAAPPARGTDPVHHIFTINLQNQREFLRLLDTRYSGINESCARLLDHAALFPPATVWATATAAALRSGFAAVNAAWRSVARTVQLIAAMSEANAADAAKVIDIGSARLLPFRRAA